MRARLLDLLGLLVAIAQVAARALTLAVVWALYLLVSWTPFVGAVWIVVTLLRVLSSWNW